MGCPTNYDGRNYTWNRGKLTSITKGSLNQAGSLYESCAFTYDGYGRRKTKTYIYDSNSAATSDYSYRYDTDYTYDGSGRLIRETLTESMTYSGGGSITREFIYLYDDSGMIGVMYGPDLDNLQTYYYRRNVQGDVTAIYDINGNRKVEYAYDAFGNCEIIYGISHDLARRNPIRYRGYYLDRETGLYYLNARYYNPQWRRFIQPAVVTSLNPHSINGLNLYSYASNNPIGIVYRTNVGVNNAIIKSNSKFNVIAHIFNQMSSNSSSFSLKPLTFSFGLVTPGNPKLPKGVDFSAFYVSGHLGFGGGYGKSPEEKGSFGLSFASLELGIVNMKCDVVTFDEDTALYLGVGALNANASLGLGFSGSVEIVSFYFGAKLNDYVSIDGKVYTGWGISLDFSEGVKIGIAVGVGFEISINF